jgi:hypothetical protein
MPKLEVLETEPATVPQAGYALLYYDEVDGVIKLMAKLSDGSSVQVV